MSSGASHGRRKKGHGEHEEHVNHEAWVIPYADILTLLMALFLVMFAIGRIDQEKFDKAASGFRNELGGGAAPVIAGTGAQGILDGGTGDATKSQVAPVNEDPADPLAAQAQQALANQRAAEEKAAQQTATLDTVEKLIADKAEAAGLRDAVGFRREERGLVVTVATDQVLFNSGDANLQQGGVAILDGIADALAAVPNQIMVEGHTDSRPIATAQYPSNWELSTARATSVLRYLVDRHGIDMGRISAAGYADTRPIGDNATEDGKARNRRVEVVVLADRSTPTAPPAG